MLSIAAGVTGSAVTKAHDQLITALKDVAASAAQLDLMEKMLNNVLQHRRHMAKWDNIR